MDEVGSVDLLVSLQPADLSPGARVFCTPRGRKHSFELTRPLAEHLQWLLSVRQPLAADELLTPEEIAEQSGGGEEDRASE